MPTIAKNNEVVTVIFSFAVEPERQQELIEMMIDALETTTKHQSGFVSASFHKSLDGVRVFNYAQWRTLGEYEAFAQSPQDQAIGARLSQFQLLDSRIYEVVISKPDDATLKITKGDLIHFAEFRVKPENQQRLIELERENVVIALEHPNLLCANFHRSVDGARTANYGQWRSLDNFEALLKEPTYESVREYWKGLAENEFHLYKVVYTEPLE
ncbi:antibiotic biosynthesis monooxygenase [Gloeocapsopsis dulcis]|uniref:Antibiotic biosynthesis monooxygenase n=1 Tax=Gloeocapsopsis dulcis AAB1 = 1H9 TaxID=1433147 RepID=A0A6N8G0P4_9CHRO|nr:antibiotic biosynthesis monooxygenase [Gloeocapsopsis dulcis]MUL38564.1 antibiotic biosynthesis monooxygenase [Gloeocapsopsis dulcis AAB1 = 1H9]WNN90695.1 antibiotic biosynthesis monooxygenase [Gloeocapsopsis dulcis]